MGMPYIVEVKFAMTPAIAFALISMAMGAGLNKLHIATTSLTLRDPNHGGWVPRLESKELLES